MPDVIKFSYKDYEFEEIKSSLTKVGRVVFCLNWMDTNVLLTFKKQYNWVLIFNHSATIQNLGAVASSARKKWHQQVHLKV